MYSSSNEVDYAPTDIFARQLDGGMLLEPRLQEYYKMKKYYKANNIHSGVSLEKRYMITSTDIKILKAYFRGESHMYDKTNPKSKRYNYQYSDEVYINDDVFGPRSKPKQEFESTRLIRTDPKLKKMEKALRDRNKLIAEHSGAYRQTQLQDSSQQFNPIPSSMDQFTKILDSRDLTDNALKGIIAESRVDLQNNRETIENVDEQSTNPMGFKINSNNMYYNSGNGFAHEQPPQLVKNFMANTPYIYEECDQQRIPLNAKKSYGYANPAEHQYQYLDGTFHNSFELGDRGGYPTRIDNRMPFPNGS